MKIYQNMPRELAIGWPMEEVFHEGKSEFDFHYHEVDEWLEVLKGKITFFSATNKEYELSKGNALQIPRGEIHRVQIGPDGVEYNMWLPVEVPDKDFIKKLEVEDLSLIEKNFAVPKAEDSEDRAYYKRFFDDFLSKELTFRTAEGKLLDKNEFLKREPANITRTASDCVHILHKSSESVLLSTVVHMEPKDGPRQSYSNLRLFAREKGMWKCQVWLNYREFVSS